MFVISVVLCIPSDDSVSISSSGEPGRDSSSVIFDTAFLTSLFLILPAPAPPSKWTSEWFPSNSSLGKSNLASSGLSSFLPTQHASENAIMVSKQSSHMTFLPPLENCKVK
uniref:Uncharacterized protein n=1 Tax=Opuntia streptacantha TaxID=393608 RepID=A0A7C9EIX1_OPUST